MVTPQGRRVRMLQWDRSAFDVMGGRIYVQSIHGHGDFVSDPWTMLRGFAEAEKASGDRPFAEGIADFPDSRPKQKP